MNILITGITGSGGSYLAEYILENHPEVKVHGTARWHSTTSLSNIEGIKDRITLHECDLLDLATIIRIFREVKPDRIFNLASHANVRVCFDNPTAVLHNNVMLMANLLEATRLECPESIFQQCSTSEVYGTPETIPIKESHPLQPVNPYAVSKLTQEGLAYAYHKSWGLRCIITRMFAYVNGRRQELFATAFAHQVARIEAGLQKPILRHGNLESIRTLIDVRDAVRTYWVACAFCTPGEAYNIGGTVPISIKDFLKKLHNFAKVDFVDSLDSSLLRPVDVTNQVPDTTKFDTLTEWEPEYTLDDSIEFLLEHCRKELNGTRI